MVKPSNNTNIFQTEKCPPGSSSPSPLSFLAKVTCIPSFLSVPADSLYMWICILLFNYFTQVGEFCRGGMP